MWGIIHKFRYWMNCTKRNQIRRSSWIFDPYSIGFIPLPIGIKWCVDLHTLMYQGWYWKTNSALISNNLEKSKEATEMLAAAATQQKPQLIDLLQVWRMLKSRGGGVGTGQRISPIDLVECFHTRIRPLLPCMLSPHTAAYGARNILKNTVAI